MFIDLFFPGSTWCKRISRVFRTWRVSGIELCRFRVDVYIFSVQDCKGQCPWKSPLVPKMYIVSKICGGWSRWMVRDYFCSYVEYWEIIFMLFFNFQVNKYIDSSACLAKNDVIETGFVSLLINCYAIIPKTI